MSYPTLLSYERGFVARERQELQRLNRSRHKDAATIIMEDVELLLWKTAS